MSSSFNLPSPSGFRGLDAHLPVRRYQRHLPHWRQDGATYFVTFRLADSIPQQHLQALKRWRATWEKDHPEPRSEDDWQALAREITSKTEAWLDEGYGDCVLGNMAAADSMTEALLKFQDARCVTTCLVVMPNHIHAVMRPLSGFELEDLLQGAKGYVARKLNEALGRSGQLWEEESYDRIIRDEEHLWRVIQYIGRNPRKAGLSPIQYRLWLHPEWEKAGWGFVDR
jgi:REP element-mobilizing transposase RayT